MAATYILARTFGDAHRFAKNQLDLDRGQYRVVNSVGTLKAIRGADLHLVPGWKRRADRFVMQSGLRWSRMNVIDHEAQVPRVDTIPEILLLDATDFFVDLLDDIDETPDQTGPLIDWNHVGDPIEDIEKAKVIFDEAPSAKRRRSRCNDCGTLHFKEESCPVGES